MAFSRSPNCNIKAETCHPKNENLGTWLLNLQRTWRAHRRLKWWNPDGVSKGRCSFISFRGFVVCTKCIIDRSSKWRLNIISVRSFMWTPRIYPWDVPTYRTRIANLAIKCWIIILIFARSCCSYNNILIIFGQLYSNSCYTTFSVVTLGMCIACEFHQLWAVRPCIYHIFRHLTKWLIFCRTGHVGTLV